MSVGIGEHHQVAGGRPQSAGYGCAIASVFRVSNEACAGISLAIFLDEQGGFVSRAIVDDDQLKVLDKLGQDRRGRFERVENIRLLVVGRQTDRKPGGVRQPRRSQLSAHRLRHPAGLQLQNFEHLRVAEQTAPAKDFSQRPAVALLFDHTGGDLFRGDRKVLPDEIAEQRTPES